MRNALSYAARTAGLALVCLFAWAAGGRCASAQSYWFEDYEKAVDLIDHGRVDEASVIVDRLLEEHPNPVACQRLPGDRCVMYCPYFQRARIQYRQGNLAGAAHSLEVSGAFGAIHRDKRAQREYQRLRKEVHARIGAQRKEPAVTPVSN